MNLDRRSIVLGGLALAGCTQAGTAPARTADVFYIGIYSDAVFPLTEINGQWQVGEAQTGLDNVAFGYRSKSSGKVWLLHESGDHSAISRQGKGKGGWLTTEGRWPAKGNSPCYISGDQTGAYFATANYMTGNVVIWREGETPEAIADLSHSGTGPNTSRQEGPHSHWVGFTTDNRRIYSVDLGTDEILTWPFDAAAGTVGEKTVAFKTAPGAGPRHMLFNSDGKHAYIINELDNTLLTVLVNGDGSLTEVQKLSCLPADYADKNQAAHIAFDASGKVLYVSNRGHNSIGVFAVGDDATLTAKQWVSCGGNWPRFFRVFDQKMWVANQNSNDLVQFDIAVDGGLTASGLRLSVPSPIFIGDLPA